MKSSLLLCTCVLLGIALLTFAGCACWPPDTVGDPQPGVAMRYDPDTDTWESANSSASTMQYDSVRKEWYHVPEPAGGDHKLPDTRPNKDVDDATSNRHPQDDKWK